MSGKKMGTNLDCLIIGSRYIFLKVYLLIVAIYDLSSPRQICDACCPHGCKHSAGDSLTIVWCHVDTSWTQM